MEWRAGGLRLPSTVRLSRLDCLEQSLFIGRIGTISTNDAQAIRQIWAAHIKPQF
jgi:mRNA interferase MazF